MNAIRSFCTTWKSSSCWSKWRASSSTVFSSSRSLLRSARSRKLPAMRVAPMAMAAISSVPPTISQRIGPPRKADAILEGTVLVEAIERNRRREVNFRTRSSPTPGPRLRYRVEMELTLASLVNETLSGGEGCRRQPQGGCRSSIEPDWRNGANRRAACRRSAGRLKRLRELRDSLGRVTPSLHRCQGSMRSFFHDAVRLRAARHGATLVEAQPGVTGIGIARALVLAIGVWVVERAIAGFAHHLLGRCRRGHHRKRSRRTKKPVHR